MTKKRFTLKADYDWWGVVDTTGEIKGEYGSDCFSTEDVVDLLNKMSTENRQLKQENEQLKQQVEDLEFKLRTIKAYDRTVKEEHSDTVYDFQKKLERW